jgi:pyruvate dehydrogenase E2 component (dihydrolipoamide acetyltransferase)
LKACTESLQEFPELNARLDGDEIVYLDRYDIGVAVQTGQGLVVPVVRDCDSRSLDELQADLERLAEAARAGTLAPEDLRGSTFTVTSAGKLAGLFQTPIVNHPEVAILSVGRVAERAVVRDGRVVAAPTGYVSVTFDHRVVDGARAAEFGLAVIRRLEAS